MFSAQGAGRACACWLHQAGTAGFPWAPTALPTTIAPGEPAAALHLTRRCATARHAAGGLPPAAGETTGLPNAPGRFERPSSGGAPRGCGAEPAACWAHGWMCVISARVLNGRGLVLGREGVA